MFGFGKYALGVSREDIRIHGSFPLRIALNVEDGLSA
jgi:hypothetical protein